MKCKLCGSSNIKMIYKGSIRDGGLGKYTDENMEMYQCHKCNVIWHEDIIKDLKEYYESKEYRNSLEGTSEEEDFYRLHDKESLEKFKYTGTTIFRNKVVADIGCGCGAFLDYIKGVAKEVVAIEPSETYRQIMERKGYHTYAYAKEAYGEKANALDVIVSFDVIEHVEDPRQFMTEVYDLLSDHGISVIGTPTDAPVMREVLGEIYEKKLLFSTQHLWIFSEENLKMLAKQVGFRQCTVRYFQRYGLSNFIGWVKEQRACGESNYSFVTDTMDALWKSELNGRGASDYIVIYLRK